MSIIVFTAILASVLCGILTWGFYYLPGERWQFLAAIPIYKKKNGDWRSINLTYYGVFVATSQLFAITLLLVLLGSINVRMSDVFVTVTILLAFCIPASRVIAMIVERKRHTFTIGGASFVGIILAPWVVLLVDSFINIGPYSQHALPLLATLAALSVSYTLGEGLGRLACLSYGCCYGKPVSESGPVVQKVFSKMNCIFYGQNKKVAYEGNLCGKPLIPIQAITCILYCLGSLIGVVCFLQGYFAVALLLTLFLTQIWRILSETFRADFRGFGKVSAYQKMGVIAVVYMSAVVFFVLPNQPLIVPLLLKGTASLWRPEIILFLQLLWVVFFVFFGRSSVTTSTLHFQLLKKNI